MSLTELMSRANLDHYAQVALVAFMVAFGLILWRTFSRRNRAQYEDHMRMLPLKDD
jgi:cbb3-type cytochrome oxidase subunit 3